MIKQKLLDDEPVEKNNEIYWLGDVNAKQGQVVFVFFAFLAVFFNRKERKGKELLREADSRKWIYNLQSVFNNLTITHIFRIKNVTVAV